jgi:hypothetical protein
MLKKWVEAQGRRILERRYFGPSILLMYVSLHVSWLCEINQTWHITQCRQPIPPQGPAERSHTSPRIEDSLAHIPC